MHGQCSAEGVLLSLAKGSSVLILEMMHEWGAMTWVISRLPATYALTMIHYLGIKVSLT
jgi:hypothetical protein